MPDGRPPLSAVTGVRLASTDHAAVAVCTCRRRVNGQLVLLAGIISVNAKESAMAMGDKIEHAAEEAGGKVKEATGKQPITGIWRPKVTAIRLRRTSSKPETRPRTPSGTS